MELSTVRQTYIHYFKHTEACTEERLGRVSVYIELTHITETELAEIMCLSIINSSVKSLINKVIKTKKLNPYTDRY